MKTKGFPTLNDYRKGVPVGGLLNPGLKRPIRINLKAIRKTTPSRV